jgi:putative ABC transport system substrate-binding protein
MRRRDFIGAVLSVTINPAHAQSSNSRQVRIGFLSNYDEKGGNTLVRCFTEALGSLGWVEGRNLHIEYRWANSVPANYASYAREFAALNLDIIAVNSTPASQAIRKALPATGTPTVFMSVSDPVASGLVESISRPGANMTGLSNFFPATSAKLLEMIAAVVPGLSNVMILRDAGNPGKSLDTKAIEEGAARTTVKVVDGGVHNADQLKSRIEEVAGQPNRAVIVLVDGITLASQNLILRMVADLRIPAIYQVRDFVDAGGLMSYGLDFCKHFARAAGYVDKILRGAKPAELPVEMPTTFELVVNLRAARALKLSIPPTVIALADEVIE